MKALLILATFFIPLFATHDDSMLPEAMDDEGYVTIKVLIRENVDGALIDVAGGYRVYNLENGKVLSSSFHGKRYYLQANSVGLKWGEEYPGIHQIKITPKNSKTTILVDGIQYKGSIIVYDINSSIQIVNEVDVEDVLRASLSSLLGNTSYEAATYDSVAIAARTNLYNTIVHSPNTYWNVHARDIDYLNRAAVLSNPNIERSVLSTKHPILAYNDKPFATSWTEHSGGRRASYESIFRKKASVSPTVTFINNTNIQITISMTYGPEAEPTYDLSNGDFSNLTNQIKFCPGFIINPSNSPSTASVHPSITALNFSSITEASIMGGSVQFVNGSPISLDSPSDNFNILIGDNTITFNPIN